MASRALDKLINTRYRRFSESNFLLCKQTVVSFVPWSECNNNNNKKNRWNERLWTCAAATFAVSLGDNDANHWCWFSNTRTQKDEHDAWKQDDHSEIYVKDVKKTLCQSMWWKDIYLQM